MVNKVSCFEKKVVNRQSSEKNSSRCQFVGKKFHGTLNFWKEFREVIILKRNFKGRQKTEEKNGEAISLKEENLGRRSF